MTTKRRTVPGKHKQISHTAFPVAYSRTFSDIPYSQEIAELCDATSLAADNAEMHRQLAPYFEARSKALTILAQSSGAKNFLELASGMGSRDLIITRDPSVNYIETDLPDMIRQKQGVLESLCEQHDMPWPDNLKLRELNGLDEEAFDEVVLEFPPGPITIIHEGWLAYLDYKEKARVAVIIRKILLERGGVWLTPDLNTQDNMDALTNNKSQKVMGTVLKKTGRDYVANAFANKEEVQKFFAGLGFNSACRTIGEIAGPLESVKNVPDLDPEHLSSQLSILIWEFRPLR